MKKFLKPALLSFALSALVLATACGAHKHEFSEDWTGTAEGHYRKAVCGHDERTATEKHKFDSGEIDGDYIIYTCAVCNWQKRDERFPGHTHEFDEEWTGSHEGHYHKALCGHEYAQKLEEHDFVFVRIEGTNKIYSCTECEWVITEYYNPLQ